MNVVIFTINSGATIISKQRKGLNVEKTIHLNRLTINVKINKINHNEAMTKYWYLDVLYLSSFSQPVSLSLPFTKVL